MGLDYRKLPKHMRDQVDAKLGRTPHAPRQVRAQASDDDDGHGLPLTCANCDARFERWSETAIGRHRDSTGHARFDLVLEG